MPCFLITSDVTANEVAWYIKEKNDYIPIVICENTPEESFGEEILKRFKNSFLAEGKLSADGKTLEIYSWNICAPIDRGVPVHGTRVFLRRKMLKMVHIYQIV